jgi:hydroxymethylglutaryl-CoA reductase
MKILDMMEASNKLNKDLMDLYFKCEALLKVSSGYIKDKTIKSYVEEEIKKLEADLQLSMKSIKTIIKEEEKYHSDNSNQNLN